MRDAEAEVDEARASERGVIEFGGSAQMARMDDGRAHGRMPNRGAGFIVGCGEDAGRRAVFWIWRGKKIDVGESPTVERCVELLGRRVL